MAYTPQTWADLPSETTPLSAARLNYIENGIADLGVFQSYTPAWTNLTVGNGNVTARYTQVGKTVSANVQVNFGTTTSVSGAVSFSLPTPPQRLIGVYAYLLDNGTALYSASAFLSGGLVSVRTLNALGAYSALGNLSSTVPFTWTTSDVIYVALTYEAA